MVLAVGRKMFLMRAPTQFTGLRAFADKTIDGPGIDELKALLAGTGDLRIALGAMNHLHTQLHCELRPLRP